MVQPGEAFKGERTCVGTIRTVYEGSMGMENLSGNTSDTNLEGVGACGLYVKVRMARATRESDVFVE